MIEYPMIRNSSKAPREYCIAFEKLDGSNFRAKWTKKKSFDLFGTRTQLIDENTPLYGEGIKFFKEKYSEWLDSFFRENYKTEREITVFGEFFGPNSFAGSHVDTDNKEIVIFDIMIGHRHDRYFVKPTDLIKYYSKIVKLPRVVYEGNLTDEFIKDVRQNKFNLNEGVICKGTKTRGDYTGKVWMCKIKTQEYLDKLVKNGLDLNVYGE